MNRREYFIEYDKHVKEASTFYHRHVPKRVARQLSFFFFKKKFTPNSISIISFCLLLVSLIPLLIEVNILHILAFYLISLLSYSLDCMDGVIARLTNSSTQFGAFLDLFFDRLGQLILFIAIFHILSKEENIVYNYSIGISLISFYFYTYTSILRSYKLNSLNGTVKNMKYGFKNFVLLFLYEFIDTGIFYFILSLSLFFNISEYVIIFYGYISVILITGIIIYSYKNS